MQINDIIMGIETAIPCGLIINELISNTLKHAFPQGKGEIYLELSTKDNDKYQLIVRDNGKSFQENFKFDDTNTLGMKLISSLVNQLDGKITLNKDNKEFTIEFEELKYKERI
jgi:two-component system sensor kinase